MVENKSARSPGRPRRFNPEEALEKVISVFWEVGYDAADTETLSRHTGFSKPSLYKAFGSKEDLFVAALNQYMRSRMKLSLVALTQAPTPFEGLREYFICFSENVAGPNQPRGCLIFSIAIPLRNRLQKVGKLLDELPGQRLIRMKAYFDEHKKNGNLPESFDNNAAIALISDLTAALAFEARAGAPVSALKKKAVRNARLVLIEGGTSPSNPKLSPIGEG